MTDPQRCRERVDVRPEVALDALAPDGMVDGAVREAVEGTGLDPLVRLGGGEWPADAAAVVDVATP